MNGKPYFYTNGAIVGFSANDVTLVFQRRSLPARTAPTVGDHSTQIVDEIDIVTSPRHAKSLAAALLDSIASYEAQHGPIPMSPEDVKKLNDALAKYGVQGKRQ